MDYININNKLKESHNNNIEGIENNLYQLENLNSDSKKEQLSINEDNINSQSENNKNLWKQNANK